MDEVRKPEFSSQFNADDIRKFGHSNSKRHFGMTREEIIEDIRKSGEEIEKDIQKSLEEFIQKYGL